MATFPQKELTNEVAEVLQRSEVGEELTVTVSRAGRIPGPGQGPSLGVSSQLVEPWRAPADPTLEAAIAVAANVHGVAPLTLNPDDFK